MRKYKHRKAPIKLQKLHDYIVKNFRGGYNEAARSWGIPSATLWGYTHTPRLPDPQRAEHIIQATGGIITIEDIYSVSTRADAPLPRVIKQISSHPGL